MLLGLLRGLLSLLCSLFSCHGSILPFPFVMECIATVTSSQFVSCIESTKKIVKKKTRIKVCNSATLQSHPLVFRRAPSSLRRRKQNLNANCVRETPHEDRRFLVFKFDDADRVCNDDHQESPSSIATREFDACKFFFAKLAKASVARRRSLT